MEEKPVLVSASVITVKHHLPFFPRNEDSVFLRDALQHNLRVIAIDAVLSAYCQERSFSQRLPSTLRMQKLLAILRSLWAPLGARK